MSTQRTLSSRNKQRQLPPNAEKYCPDYIKFDQKARQDSKIRFKEHVLQRRQFLVQCIDAAIDEIRNTVLALEFNPVPRYMDDDKIVNDAINTMNKAINKWDGVQFSKQFIQEFNKSGTKMNGKKFDTIARNHQDQTSWKISGNKFFAPYIARARQYIYQYCQCIININQHEREEIYKLGCISYAVALLKQTIRFHRTKPKPLIRHKTLVKSEGIHIELEELYSLLEVKEFIAAAKKKRKTRDGKGTVKSKDFHQKLLNCCYTLYYQQKQRVYDMFDIIYVDDNDDLKNEEQRPNVYPQDLKRQDDDDGNHDNNDKVGYERYESPLPSTYSSHSSNSSSLYSRYNNQSPREFQYVNPRQFGVRNEVNRNKRRDERRIRSQNREMRIQERRQYLNENDNGQYIGHNQTNQHNGHNNESFDDMIFPQISNQHNPNLLTSMGNVSGGRGNDLSLSSSVYRQVPAALFVDDKEMIGSVCNCGQLNCHCDSLTTITTNSESCNNNKRLCQMLKRENDDLKRERDELLLQMQNMQNMQNMVYPTYQYQPPQYQLQQYEPQYVAASEQVINFTNDNIYFNALPPQLRFLQPSMLIRGSSLNNDLQQQPQQQPINHDNNGSRITTDIRLEDLDINPNNIVSPPPFIDNSNGVICDDDVEITDIPSLPNN